MNVWDAYQARLGTKSDDPKRSHALSNAQSAMLRRITSSLSYQHVTVDGQDRALAIVESTDFNIKKVFSMPGEDIPHGKTVEWSGSVWLITERNARCEFCAEGKMRRCNYVLKWIDDTGNVISRWCVVEDGTKYLIGERSENIMSVGDARIAVTIGKDRDTEKLRRGKRFLIDDMDSDEVLAYRITKPNKLYNVYNGSGVFRFILTEENVTDNDNTELRIADYYSWKPVQDRPVPDTRTDDNLEKIVADAEQRKQKLPEDIREKKVWI